MRTRLVSKLGVGALLLGGVTLAVLPSSAWGTQGTGSTQTVSFSPSPLLSVTAAPVSVGNLNGGTNNTGISLGTNSIVISDTLADTSAWTTSVAASNCAPLASTINSFTGLNLNVGGITVPSTALTYHPGGSVTTVVPLATTGEIVPSAGTGGAFAAVPSGQTYSDPQTVSTASATTAIDNNGIFEQSPSIDINLSNVPAVAGGYSCTLQYTIVG
jgi:hypothetical protein